MLISQSLLVTTDICYDLSEAEAEVGYGIVALHLFEYLRLRTWGNISKALALPRAKISSPKQENE